MITHGLRHQRRRFNCPHSFVVLTLQNGLEYCNSDFKRFNDGDLATSCENMVYFGPVTPEFARVVSINPLIDQQFSYVCLVAQLLDTAAISTEFYGAISTQFCSPIRLGGGITAMPDELHTRLCHAFLLF